MRLASRRGEHAHGLVAVGTPGLEYPVAQNPQAKLRLTAQANDRERPVNDGRTHIREIGELDVPFSLCPRHRELVASSLKVIVCKDGPTHDGQVGIGADDVVWKGPDEVEQPNEGL